MTENTVENIEIIDDGEDLTAKAAAEFEKTAAGNNSRAIKLLCLSTIAKI